MKPNDRPATKNGSMSDVGRASFVRHHECEECCSWRNEWEVSDDVAHHSWQTETRHMGII